MSLFNKEKEDGGFMNIIRCDEPSYLIWKWHLPGTDPQRSKRANSIRWGSSLRVKEGSVAVLVYPREGGYVQEYVEGPCDMFLQTENLPILTSLLGTLYNGDSPFQAEVYFINLAQLLQVKFGVPYFDLFDPRFLDFGVPTAVRGSISFQIADYEKFIQLHKLESFNLEDFQRQVRDAVVKTVKGIVTNIPEKHGIPVVQIERKLPEINALAEESLKEQLSTHFGVQVSKVDIAAIELDKSSEGYQQLKAVTQDVAAAKTQAQTDVDIQRMQDMQRLETENLAGVFKAAREEAQYAQRLKTQSEHLETHRLNQQTEVGIAGAEALGKMGGSGGVDGGGGINPAAMMAGMAMGGAIGQNMSRIMGGMMAGVDAPVPPVVTYHVAVNGQAIGPYDLSALKQQALNGIFTKETLVWRPGMTAWAKAGDLEDLKGLFPGQTDIPPIPIP